MKKKKHSAPSPAEFSGAAGATGAAIIEALKRVHKPLRLDDFLRVFALPRRQKKSLEAELAALLDSGELLRLAGGAYCLASGLKEVTGTLHMQRAGIGFVLADPPQQGEIFISPQHLADAWHGDRVAVTLFPGRRGKNRDGRIARVIERARKELAARVVRRMADGGFLTESTDAHVSALFLTDCSKLPAPPGRDALLRIRPGERKGPDLWQAEALALLGDEESPQVQEELVKAEHAIPRSFPADVLAAAANLPAEPAKADMEGRKDLTHIPFVTIDGAEAKDFDDAVHVEKKGRAFLLRVAIADVAHYVAPRSALDTEALSRGNSYYFPRSVEPMLPEALSNGLCSLNPHVPRLVMVAEMTFDANGNPGKEEFYAAVIRSAARLTYDGVRDALEDRGDGVPQALLPMLKLAHELARILAATRRERGSLDFELPEPRCVFGKDGSITAIVPRDNHFIHKLIEVFMVAANEAVARFLTRAGRPLLYRAHPAPDPDKLKNLFTLLAISGLAAAKPGEDGVRVQLENPSPKALQAILDGVKGSPSEYLISRVALRTMMQAGYTQDLEGHFGLASDCYCHFTSPIRRYADLVVHRSLKAALNLPDAAPLPGRKTLQGIADHINATERTAMDAEREMFRRLSTLYMKDKVGEEFDGIISGVTDFGIFVELTGVMAEGMVRLMTLADDYYVYYPERFELRGERGGRAFRLGQSLRVRVTDVNLTRQEINLEITGADAPRSARPARSGRPGRSAQPGQPERTGRTGQTGRGPRRGGGNGRGNGNGKSGGKNSAANGKRGSRVSGNGRKKKR